MDIFEKAIIFAVNAHAGQKRKNGGPYITHPLEVASIASSMTEDEEVLAAAVLHDTVEDTKTSMEDIVREFGERVGKLVASETEEKYRELPSEVTWKKRKEESLEKLRSIRNREIEILWLSDKLSNMRSFYREYIRYGDSLWLKFNQKDPKQQYWYYSIVADITDELKDTLAWKEYTSLLKEIFRP